MVQLEGGEFLMGTEDDIGFSSDGEGPVRRVKVDGFAISPHAVSNDDFADFIDATGYTTDAERFGFSFVFHLLVPDGFGPTQAVANAPWWRSVYGADWRHLYGPDSGLDGIGDHPVVHVSWNDSQAYCDWAGVRLPTEAEWEYAARGGLNQARYPWGDEFSPSGEPMCNIFEGEFPHHNTGHDGYLATAPVDSFPSNAYGLHNVAGNVWEWCADSFTPTHTDQPLDNPTVPESGATRVIRGGSYLCHDSYCNRYRVAARSSNTPDSSTGNMGFRVSV